MCMYVCVCYKYKNCMCPVQDKRCHKLLLLIKPDLQESVFRT